MSIYIIANTRQETLEIAFAVVTPPGNSLKLYINARVENSPHQRSHPSFSGFFLFDLESNYNWDERHVRRLILVRRAQTSSYISKALLTNGILLHPISPTICEASDDPVSDDVSLSAVITTATSQKMFRCKVNLNREPRMVGEDSTLSSIRKSVMFPLRLGVVVDPIKQSMVRAVLLNRCRQHDYVDICRATPCQYHKVVVHIDEVQTAS